MAAHCLVSSYGSSLLGFLIWQVSYWFFFRNDPHERSATPVLCSTYRMLRFHLGSVAFGALLIAIVQCLRITLEYIAHLTQKGNSITKLAVSCTRALLWCLEKSVRYVSGCETRPPHPILSPAGSLPDPIASGIVADLRHHPHADPPTS